MEVNHFLARVDDDLSIAADLAAHCAGALIMLNNACKRSRDRSIARMQDAAGKSPDVFTYPTEFTAHHGDQG